MNMTFKYTALACFMTGLLACSCGQKTVNNTSSVTQDYKQVSPDFNSDSAYHFADKQVAFGPRVPNSEAHKACGDYLVAELERFGATVTQQKADLKAFDGTILHARNIIGAFSPEKTDRILLFAHWDTRPFSDKDPDEKNYHTPVQGANDGASGVGVLLEVARILQEKTPDLGVDIIFFDAEDYGAPAFAHDIPSGEGWCLGSEYWSKNPHVPGYKARFGILLDMVGAPDATFYKEAISRQYAQGIVEKVWSTARDLGYGRYFVDKNGGGITDDHVPVNENRGIPSIDIIQYDLSTDSGFGWYHHTTKDDMNNISKETLKAVGQTVLEVVYKEK